MNGILYGVGIGPGDPELITLKAVRIIEQCPVIAVPQTGKDRRVALSIAEQAVPRLHEKEILSLPFPMTRDTAVLEANRNAVATQLAAVLQQGKDVAFLTLGDPTIYSTYFYIHRRIQQQGFTAQMVAGVPSFCAVAAKLDLSLAQAEEPITIIPASYPCTAQMLQTPGTKVLMKTGKAMEQVKTLLQQNGFYDQAKMVQNCGLEGERIFLSLDQADNSAGYLSVIISREEAL